MAVAVELDYKRALLIRTGKRAGIAHDVDVAVRVGRDAVRNIIPARPDLQRPQPMAAAIDI